MFASGSSPRPCLKYGREGGKDRTPERGERCGLAGTSELLGSAHLDAHDGDALASCPAYG